MRVQADGLTFAYGAHEVLRGVTFAAEGGRLLSVLGPNGVGKSTLFGCLLGLLPGYGGRILFDGADARRMGPRQIARRAAYIPQTHYPAVNYAVFDMVLMGTTHTLGAFASPGAAQRAAAQAALERMGVAHLAGRSFARLSGGEQQLVLIARALAQRSPVLLMDEPTSALDPISTSKIEDLVMDIKKEYTIVMVTHNMQQAVRVSDTTVFFLLGEIIESGATGQMFSVPKDKRTEDYITGRFG